MIAICGYAQPRKTIIAVAVAPEHTDWQYRCGEDVKFDLSVLKTGIPLENAEVYYEISEDMQTPLKKGNMTLKDGTAQIKAGTMRIAGSLSPGLRSAGTRIVPDIRHPFLWFWKLAE